MFKSGARIITVDIAHGHSKNMKRTIQWMRREYGEEICIIGGNIATYEATMDLASWGVDIVKVGVGPGSRCSTRTSTGVGRAAGVAIIECKRAVTDIMKNFANNPDIAIKDIKIIADGGMSLAGDLPKVISLGADAGMFGKMIAGTTETPGLVYKNSEGQYQKNFGGSSSAENKGKDEFVEGFVSPVVFIGKVKYVLRSLDHGLRSAMSYSGCSNIKDFQKNVKLHVISHGSQRESKF